MTQARKIMLQNMAKNLKKLMKQDAMQGRSFSVCCQHFYEPEIIKALKKRGYSVSIQNSHISNRNYMLIKF